MNTIHYVRHSLVFVYPVFGQFDYMLLQYKAANINPPTQKTISAYSKHSPDKTSKRLFGMVNFKSFPFTFKDTNFKMV